MNMILSCDNQEERGNEEDNENGKRAEKSRKLKVFGYRVNCQLWNY